MRLLWAGTEEHGKAGSAYRHYVAMIAEDGQRMCGQSPCCNVEDSGRELTRYLIHVRYHEQQALRTCKRGGQCAALKRAVDGARGTCFTLHFYSIGRASCRERV